MGHLLSKGFPGVGHLTGGVIFVFQVMEWDYFANEPNAGGGGGSFSNANDCSLFNEITLYEPLLQASSSPVPRTRI